MENEPNIHTKLPVHSYLNDKEMMLTQLNETSTVKSEDVIAKSMTNFHDIVKCLSENVVVEYLHDILSFLLSDRSDVRFEASGYAKLFLDNLLKSVDNLNCIYFNKRCASMSKQIIKVLNNKKDVYKCVSYCEKDGDHNVIVFKKEPTSEATCCEDDSCCGTSSLQSITENLHSECPNYNSHKVSHAFKSRWLNTTLRFIKDESKHVHKYPEMSPMEATFVYSLITRCKEQSDITPNSYYTPLKEAMRIYSLKYFFELTYLETYANGKMCLMLEKIPKDIKSIIEGDKRCSNRFRNMKFIKQLKTRTSDENRAGLVVSRLKNQERIKIDPNRLGDLTPTETERQLTQDPSIPSNGHSDNCTQNMDMLNVFAAKRSRQNQVGMGGNYIAESEGGGGGGGARASRRDRSAHSRTDKLLRDMSVPIKSDKAMRMMYGMGWDGGALGVRGEGITEPIIPTITLKAGAGLGHTVRSLSTRREPMTMERKAPRPPSVDNTTTRPPPVKIETPRPLPVENNTLEVAVESIKSCLPSVETKEPPMLYVELKSPPPPPPLLRISIPSYRTNIFQCLLDMITSCDKKRQVRTDKHIAKKEKGFITHAVRAANERTQNICVPEPLGLKIWASIVDEMTTDPDLHIKVTISDRMITLVKDDSPYMSKRKKRNIIKKESLRKMPVLPKGSKKLITNDFLREVTDTYVTPFTQSGVSTKAETGVTFRVVILIHLFDTIISDRMETEIEFEKALNDKERDYLNNTVATLGTRKKRGGSRLEQDLLVAMKDNLQGFLLRVEFINDRIFKVYKVEKKIMEKSFRDVSYTTSSTDDIFKNNSRCSDESDMGPEYILENDDNDGDDEQNDSNDASEASKAPNVHTQHGQASARSIEETISHETMSIDDKKKGNASNDSDLDKPNKANSGLEMDVLDSINKSTHDILKMDYLESAKETINILKSNAQPSECLRKDRSLTEIDPHRSEKRTKSNSKKHKLPPFRGTLEISIQDMEKNMETTNTGRKSPVFDILQSNVANINMAPEMKLLETNTICAEEKTDTNILQKCIETVGKETIEVLTDNNIERDPDKQEIKEEKTTERDIHQNVIITERKQTQNTKINKYIKRVYIVPSAYPVEEVDTEFAKYIQIIISKQIEMSTELPLLKCHGVQDGALIYSCHSENTLKWLKNICAAKNIKIMIPVNDEVRYKMSLKINSFIDYTSAKLFQMLQLYNESLRTESWVELSLNKSSDSLTFVVEIDEKSLKCIKDSNFTLFAGIDQVQFNPENN